MRIFGPPNIGKLTTKRDVDGLIKALAYGKDAEVREAAARSLGGLADQRAIGPLVGALTDSAWDVREAAVRALGTIGDARAVAPLTAVANSKEEDDLVLEAAAEALLEIGVTDAETKELARFISYKGFSTKDPAKVVKALFGRLLPVAPPVQISLVDYEYDRITGGHPRFSRVAGSHDELSEALLGHLRRIRKQSGFQSFTLGTSASGRWVHVTANLRGRTIFPMRAWRSGHSYVACVFDEDSLTEYEALLLEDNWAPKPSRGPTRKKLASSSNRRRSAVDGRPAMGQAQIQVPPRGGGYDSAPLLLEVAPALDELLTDPPVVQALTEDNRRYWSSAPPDPRRIALFTGYLQHPDPKVRLSILDLLTAAEYSAGISQLLVDLLGADLDDAVRRRAARTIWACEGDVCCEYAVDKLRDEIKGGVGTMIYAASGLKPLGPERARRALALLIETAPTHESGEALDKRVKDVWNAW